MRTSHLPRGKPRLLPVCITFGLRYAGKNDGNDEVSDESTPGR